MGVRKKTVSLNNTGQFNGVSGSGFINGSFTVNAGNQKVLMVGYHGRNRYANYIKYNNINLTSWITQTGFDGCLTQWWYLINPPEGTFTLETNLLNASDGRDFVAVICLNNADQVNPINTYVQSEGISGSIATNITTTYDNTFLINGNFNTTSFSGNAYAGWTLYAERDGGDSGGSSYTFQATSGTYTTGFTNFSQGDTAFRYIVFEVTPADFDGGAFLYNFI